MSLPLRFTLRLLANIILVWWMAGLFPGVFLVTGGIAGWIFVGAILTLLNFSLLPVLSLVTLPLRLVASLAAFLLTNGIFAWLAVKLVSLLDPSVVQLHIGGGWAGWLTVILVFGIANWLMRIALH